MSKIKLTGHASGSGVLTIAAPNTDTDRTITLPDVTGTLLDSGSDLPAANLTGTVADARISALTASKLTGTLPAISGANLTNLPAQTLTGLTDTTVSTSDPAINTNPSATGHIWVNKTSGEAYIATDVTAGSNVWKNIGDGEGKIPPPVAASGGTVTTYGSYKVHTFTSDGTFTPTSVSGDGYVEYLIIAGGGGGGRGGESRKATAKLVSIRAGKEVSVGRWRRR